MAILSKKDYFIAVIVGVATVFFTLPSFKNIQFQSSGLLMTALFLFVPVLWMFGLFLGKFLSRWFSFLYQFAKFIIVGFLNTAIDFGVLNLISMFSGITAGFLVGGVNVPGFVLAATNSYFWNKFWVFRKGGDKKEKTDYSDFFSFLIVILVGAFINGGIVVLITTYVHSFAGISPERWLNIAKALATAISLIWNFVGFKFLVFRPKK